MTDRHYPTFVNDKTDEDKLANIIVSTSLLDEVITLKLINYFLKIEDSKKNDKDRLIFEKDILSKLDFREKIDVISKLTEDEATRKKFKTTCVKIGELRNRVAHTTGLSGIPNDIEKLYDDFDALMSQLEWFIESTYSEFQGQMDRAYNPNRD